MTEIQLSHRVTDAWCMVLLT